MRVVVIEDEEDSVYLLRNLLVELGVEVVCYGSAEEALPALNTQMPDAILVDLMLPRMDGWAFLEAIRRSPALATVPVVMVSAFADSVIQYKALAVGFAACFAKPIDISTFASRVLYLLEADEE